MKMNEAASGEGQIGH